MPEISNRFNLGFLVTMLAAVIVVLVPKLAEVKGKVL